MGDCLIMSDFKSDKSIYRSNNFSTANHSFGHRVNTLRVNTVQYAKQIFF